MTKDKLKSVIGSSQFSMATWYYCVFLGKVLEAGQPKNLHFPFLFVRHYFKNFIIPSNWSNDGWQQFNESPPIFTEQFVGKLNGIPGQPRQPTCEQVKWIIYKYGTYEYHITLPFNQMVFGNFHFSIQIIIYLLSIRQLAKWMEKVSLITTHFCDGLMRYNKWIIIKCTCRYRTPKHTKKHRTIDIIFYWP